MRTSPPAATPTPDTRLPDLLRAHPGVRTVLDRHGLRGCGGPDGPDESLRFFARAHGLDEAQLLAEVRGTLAAPPPSVGGPSPARPEDAIYRPYFVSGILLALTAGATWGAILLWRIAVSGSFTSLSVHEVNAHGEAQIFGWLGLFVMGFGYQAFPRMWHVDLPAPRVALAALVAMVAGIALRTAGMTELVPIGSARHVALLGGVLETAAVAAFAAQTVTAFRRGGRRPAAWEAFVLVAVAWFVVQAVASVTHTWTTMSAGGREELLRLVSTYQAPLRDLQIHGFALTMVLGVSLRLLPALFDLREVPEPRARLALVCLTTGVLLETGLFTAFRTTGDRAYAAALLLPWMLLALGVALVALPWRLWTSVPHPDRSAGLVRAAYGWLAVSLAMLLFLPLYHALADLPFSHAYYGATRHAITVGFVSQMILGMGAKVVATLNGRPADSLPSLRGPFVLLNAGCALRVVTQTLTDLDPVFFRIVGVSGLLEVAALAWWGAGLVGIMRAGRRAAEAPARSRPPPRGAPGAVGPDDLVDDVLARHPAALSVFRAHGFHALANPLLRRTLARGVTLARAARLRGVPLDALLADLTTVVAADTAASPAGHAHLPARPA